MAMPPVKSASSGEDSSVDSVVFSAEIIVGLRFLRISSWSPKAARMTFETISSNCGSEMLVSGKADLRTSATVFLFNWLVMKANAWPCFSGVTTRWGRSAWWAAEAFLTAAATDSTVHWPVENATTAFVLFVSVVVISYWLPVLPTL
jgi:hypothetical protein